MKDEKIPAPSPTADEIAVTGPDDITRQVDENWLLTTEDDVLLTRGGGDLQLYEEVRRDGQVKATWEQCRRAVVSCDWVVEPGDDSTAAAEAAEFINEQIKHIGFDRLTDHMLWSIFYGYSVAEVVYKPGARFVEWEAIKVRNRRRFDFDGKGRLRYITPNNPNPGQIVGAPYFWHIATGGDHDDAFHGLALGHWLYWPVFFKRNGIKFWQVFLDKWASPSTIGRVNQGAGADVRAALLMAARRLRQEASAVIPEGTTLDLLESSRSGTADYKSSAEYWDREISKIVVGQTMTTDDGASLSQSKVHMEVRQDIVEADADLICESFSLGPIRWLHYANFADTVPAPTVRRIVETPEDANKLAERDERLARIGYRMTPELVAERYGDGYEFVGPMQPGPGQPAPQEPGQPAQFAEGTQDTPELLAGDFERIAAPVIDAFANGIRDRVDQLAAEGQGLEALRDELAEMAGGTLDVGELGQLLARSMALAELRGRDEIDQLDEEPQS